MNKIFHLTSLVFAMFLCFPVTSFAAWGTGWFCDEGYIVTNHHVVDPQNKGIEACKKNLILIGYKGMVQIASVIASDPDADLCLLHVEDTSKLPPALSLSREEPRIGQFLYSVGFPDFATFGLTPKYSYGELSAVIRKKDGPKALGFSTAALDDVCRNNGTEDASEPVATMFTTIPTTQGSSGSPVLNENSNVVGIVHAGFASSLIASRGIMPVHFSFVAPTSHLIALIERNRKNASFIHSRPVDAIPVPLLFHKLMTLAKLLDKAFSSENNAEVPPPNRTIPSPEDYPLQILTITDETPKKERELLVTAFIEMGFFYRFPKLVEILQQKNVSIPDLPEYSEAWMSSKLDKMNRELDKIETLANEFKHNPKQ